MSQNNAISPFLYAPSPLTVSITNSFPPLYINLSKHLLLLQLLQPGLHLQLNIYGFFFIYPYNIPKKASIRCVFLFVPRRLKHPIGDQCSCLSHWEKYGKEWEDWQKLQMGFVQRHQNPGFWLPWDAGHDDPVLSREDFPVHQSWTVGLCCCICLYRSVLPEKSRIPDQCHKCA